MLRSEVVRGQAAGGGTVSDSVVETAPDERYVAGGEFDCRFWVGQPQPGMTSDDGVNSELDGAG